MGANSKTYDGDMLVNTGGPFISVTEQLKRYVAHELGHNMVGAEAFSCCQVMFMGTETQCDLTGLFRDS